VPDGDVTVGDVVLLRPILSIHEIPPPIPQHPVLGDGVLSRLAFTLDQQHERIRFVATGPIPPPPPIRTLGFGLRARPGEAPRVGPVTSGSAADRAGLREGDAIVAIGGVPAGSLDPGRMRELTRGEGPVAVRIARGGEEREVKVEPVTLVP
jgi:S1-C subfamily serine protease